MTKPTPKAVYVLIGWLMVCVMGIIGIVSYLTATGKISEGLAVSMTGTTITALTALFTTIYLALKNKL
jgi:hypothetical protein